MSPVGIGGLFDVVLDCEDPWTLARFWSELIGNEIDPDSEDSWVSLLHSSTGPRMSFQRIAQHTPPTWPDGVPQQVHFDVAVDDVHVAEKEILKRGARILSDLKGSDPTKPWRVYADPAGHPFCLVTRPEGWPLPV